MKKILIVLGLVLCLSLVSAEVGDSCVDNSGIIVLHEGETKEVVAANKTYVVNTTYMDVDEVKINPNNMMTDKLKESQVYSLSEHVSVVIKKINKIEVPGNIGNVSFEIIGDCDFQEVIEKVETIKESSENTCNQGCLLEGACYSIGFRMFQDFCSVSLEFINQSEEGSGCDNNFECKSNLCIDNQCINYSDEDFCGEGCVFEDNCYSLGYRILDKYCSFDGQFLEQLAEENVCSNNFECKSNLCIDDECISGGLFKRMLEWFRNFFK